MYLKTGRVVIFIALFVVVAVVLGVVLVGNPLRASPGRQEGIDLERYAALKSRVEDLRQQGRDVSRLDRTIADIDYWIAQGKVAEANLRISDLESDVNNFDTLPPPVYATERSLPPVPVYAPAPESGGTVLLQEDFSGVGALAAWESKFLMEDPGNMATWALHLDALRLKLGGGGMQWVGMVDVVGQDWGDYVYSVDMLSYGAQEIGAVVRYGEGGFYRFRFLSDEHKGTPTRLLELVQGDRVVVLAQSDGPGFDFMRWYNVQFVVRGSELAVYLDGQLLFQAADGTLSQGRVGVYGLASGDAYFDNVRVTSVR